MWLIVISKWQNVISVEKGHLAHVCRSKALCKKGPHPQRKSNPCSATHVLTEDSGDYSMYNVTGSPVQPLMVTVIANSANLEMEVDTGASTSIISEQTYNQLWPNLQSTLATGSKINFATNSC